MNTKSKNKNDGTRGNDHRSNVSHSRDKKGSQVINDNSSERIQGLRPISVCFGRPDVERFITETVEGTAVTAEWANAKKGDTVAKERSLPPSRMRQVCRYYCNEKYFKIRE